MAYVFDNFYSTLFNCVFAIAEKPNIVAIANKFKTYFVHLYDNIWKVWVWLNKVMYILIIVYTFLIFYSSQIKNFITLILGSNSKRWNGVQISSKK